MKEILLTDITHVGLAKDIAITNTDRNPHVFEIRISDTVYYIGEDPTVGTTEEVVNSAESGIGLEQALSWESAVRQALMPVTPQPSLENDKSKENCLSGSNCPGFCGGTLPSFHQSIHLSILH